MKQAHNELNTVAPMLPSSSMGGQLSAADSNALYRLLSLGSPPNNFLVNQMLNQAAFMSSLSTTPNLYTMLRPWPMQPNTTSPPISPISPSQLNNNNIIHAVNADHLSMNNNCIKNNNNIKGRNPFAFGVNNKNTATTTAAAAKKAKSKRKTAVVKGVITSPVTHLPYERMQTDSMDISAQDVSLGPISPPTTGSSPQSTGSIDHPNTSAGSGGIAPSIPAPKTKTANRDKIFTCTVCGRDFHYKHVLQNHERTHTGEKPFACPEPN